MPVELLKTEINGFDEVLGGGIPKGHTILLAGPIGSHTELFGLEFVYKGALRGEKTVYVSFEKTGEDLEKLGAPYGWDIKGQIKAKNLVVMSSELFNYEQFISSLEDQIFSYKANRVVVDSISFLEGFFENKFKFRKSMDELKKMLSKHDCTSLLITESREDELSKSGIVEFVVDGIVHLHAIKKRGEVIHALTIPEMTGIEVSSQMYPVEITKEGIRVRERPLVL